MASNIQSVYKCILIKAHKTNTHDSPTCINYNTVHVKMTFDEIKKYTVTDLSYRLGVSIHKQKCVNSMIRFTLYNYFCMSIPLTLLQITVVVKVR